MKSLNGLNRKKIKMLKKELKNNLNIILSVIIMLAATFGYVFARPDNISEDTRFLASLIFNLALAITNLILGLYYNLAKKIDKK